MFGQTEAPPTLAGLVFCALAMMIFAVVIGVITVLADSGTNEGETES